MVDEIKQVKINHPNKTLIKWLEQSLEDAKSGELRAAFFCFGWAGDRVSSGWTATGHVSLIKMLGEYELSKHRLVDFIDEAYDVKTIPLDDGA